jgi:hypothetical protein
VADSRAGPAGVDEVEQVDPFGIVELEGASDRVEDAQAAALKD